MNQFWDYQNLKLVANINNSRQITSATWVLRDVLPMSLYLLQQSSITGLYSVVQLPAGYGILFGIKELTALDTPTYLAAAFNWTEAGSGQSLHYETNLQLNTAELIAAIGSGTSLDVRAEYRLTVPGGTRTSATQFGLTIWKDVNQGTEDPPAGALPTAIQFFERGGIQMVRIVNAAGQPVAELGPM